MNLFRYFTSVRDNAGWKINILIPSWRLQLRYLHEAALTGIAWATTLAIITAAVASTALLTWRLLRP